MESRAGQNCELCASYGDYGRAMIMTSDVLVVIKLHHAHAAGLTTTESLDIRPDDRLRP